MNITETNFKSKNLNIMLTRANKNLKQNFSGESDILPYLKAFDTQNLKSSFIKTNQINNRSKTDTPLINDCYAKDSDKNYLTTTEKNDG